MTMRAIDVEALAFSNLTGTNDTQSPAPASEAAAAHPTSCAQTITQWIAVACLLALAGYETFLSFALEPNGLL
jgi:hypothetical protein